MVSEFKENVQDAGYKLNDIESGISDSTVRILWPDEYEDLIFLDDWVKKRIKKPWKREENDKNSKKKIWKILKIIF